MSRVPEENKKDQIKFWKPSSLDKDAKIRVLPPYPYSSFAQMYGLSDTTIARKFHDFMGVMCNLPDFCPLCKMLNLSESYKNDRSLTPWKESAD